MCCFDREGEIYLEVDANMSFWYFCCESTSASKWGVNHVNSKKNVFFRCMIVAIAKIIYWIIKFTGSEINQMEGKKFCSQSRIFVAIAFAVTFKSKRGSAIPIFNFNHVIDQQILRENDTIATSASFIALWALLLLLKIGPNLRNIAKSTASNLHEI